jgi:hypothetical protein
MQVACRFKLKEIQHTVSESAGRADALASLWFPLQTAAPAILEEECAGSCAVSQRAKRLQWQDDSCPTSKQLAEAAGFKPQG